MGVKLSMSPRQDKPLTVVWTFPLILEEGVLHHENVR